MIFLALYLANSSYESPFAKGGNIIWDKFFKLGIPQKICERMTS
jgi:hypothetical protein